MTSLNTKLSLENHYAHFSKQHRTRKDVVINGSNRTAEKVETMICTQIDNKFIQKSGLKTS